MFEVKETYQGFFRTLLTIRLETIGLPTAAKVKCFTSVLFHLAYSRC